jgi:hypothetical protein
VILLGYLWLNVRWVVDFDYLVLLVAFGCLESIGWGYGINLFSSTLIQDWIYNGLKICYGWLSMDAYE